MLIIDILGYLGMAIALLAFLFKKVTYIRLLSMIGEVFLIIYAIIPSPSIPFIILNTSLFIINGFMLIKEKK